MCLPLAAGIAGHDGVAARAVGEARAAGPAGEHDAAASAREAGGARIGDARAVRFESMPAPTLADPAAMASVTTGARMIVTGRDGRERAYALRYEPFFVTGEPVPDGAGGTLLAGGYRDLAGRPIVDDRGVQVHSDGPDGMTLLQLPGASVPGVTGRAVFAVVQFEFASARATGPGVRGMLPSQLAVLTLDQDARTGRLRLVKYVPVDVREARGLWITCGASLSPWNTHLSSEEFEPDATRASSDARLRSFSRHLYGDPDAANPYDYGHLPEVTVRADGTGIVRKHYALGRISHEVLEVCPDERTVLMGDDTIHGGAFMFVADRPRDLSAGTLYVARWHAVSDAGPGAGRLAWIRLGHATSDEIRALVRAGIRAADIMDVRTADPGDASYTRIPYAGRANWVRLRPGMRRAAAFLETHRYAALAGGSLGFSRWEGTAVDPDARIAYVAMSQVTASMRDGSGGIRAQGPYSGAVYAQRLRGGQRDSDGTSIDSDWVPVDMTAVPELVAEDYGDGPYARHARQDAHGHYANPDRIAMPDNLRFSRALRTLFIAEDSDTHVNNFVWAYEVDARRLSRLLSVPAGAEASSLHVADDLNGYTYIACGFQHAGEWHLVRDAQGRVTGGLHAQVHATLEPLIEARYGARRGAAVGYLAAIAPEG